MLSPIHVLEGSEARVAGMELARELLRVAPERVTLDLADVSLRQALFSLPVLDAVRECFATAELRLRARTDVARVLAAYERPASRRQACGAHGDTRELTVRIELAGGNGPLPRARQVRARLTREGPGHTLLVPHAPYPAREQHATAHALDGAQVAGLPARLPRQPLRLEHATRGRARALCRELVGSLGGPLVALAPEHAGWSVAAFASVLARLDERIGAKGVVFGEVDVPGALRVPTRDPALCAALLELAAVCVGDDGDFAHLSDAVGTPTLIVHGPSSPAYSGPAHRFGAAAFSTRGSCPDCRRERGRRCLVCLDPDRVTRLAEELSVRRWPFDRLRRVLP